LTLCVTTLGGLAAALQAGGVDELVFKTRSTLSLTPGPPSTNVAKSVAVAGFAFGFGELPSVFTSPTVPTTACFPDTDRHVTRPA
jgi:hypothetical protein